MTNSKYVVVGINQYYEDGYELVCIFDDETSAEEFIDDGSAEEHADGGWEKYYSTNVLYMASGNGKCDDCGGPLDDDGLCAGCFDYDSL